MSRPDSGSVSKPHVLLVLLILAFAGVSAVHAKVSTVAMSLEVLAGRWKAVRLRNLPKDALVEVTIKADGPVSVLLLDRSSYSEFPAARRPLFHGDVADRLSFSIMIPETGHYYLVIDNRSGRQTSKVDFRIRAAKQPPAPSPRDKQNPEPEKPPLKSI